MVPTFKCLRKIKCSQSSEILYFHRAQCSTTFLHVTDSQDFVRFPVIRTLVRPLATFFIHLFSLFTLKLWSFRKEKNEQEETENHVTEFACHQHSLHLNHTEGKCEFCDYLRVKRLLEHLNRYCRTYKLWYVQKLPLTWKLNVLISFASAEN